MGFELARSLRRIKPQKFTQPLRYRPASALPFVSGAPLAGPELLLDTCVYIDVLTARSPPALDRLLEGRTINHCAVCLAEFLHHFGRLTPNHPDTKNTLRQISQYVVREIPPHRLSAASVAEVAEAGILAGLLFRLGNLAPGQEVKALNDATVFLHARAHGWTVVTHNQRDFDLLNQILPDGQVLFY